MYLTALIPLETEVLVSGCPSIDFELCTISVSSKNFKRLKEVLTEKFKGDGGTGIRFPNFKEQLKQNKNIKRSYK